METLTLVDQACSRVLDVRRRVDPRRAALIALSGIDASGKGWLASRLARALEAEGQRVALLGVDGWLALPAQRFSDVAPARHFYEHALRLDDMFAQLVLPLRAQRRVRVEVDHAEETAEAFERRLYAHEDVDVIVLEGIFLLRRRFAEHYDHAFWIDCSFETALARALARRQESLSDEETRRAYRTIYFPAQRLHFERDDPRAAADTILENDG